MQQTGPASSSSSSSSSSASSDHLPLSQLPPAVGGSENPVDVEKEEVRAGIVSEDLSRMWSTVGFYVTYMLSLALGLACVMCVFLWNSQWRGGFAWDATHLQFNWHPVLMVTGLVVVYGYGAVLYRVPLTWGPNKLPWKVLHAALMLLALVLAIVGLCAVFGVHHAHKSANLYSLHSWIGIAATSLFAIQWAMGMAVFLLPCSPPWLRKLLKPAHVWFGGSILTLSAVASISGINEKLFFVLENTNGTQPYDDLPPEAVFGNSLGVLIVAFCLVIATLLSNHRWKRPEPGSGETNYAPLPQEENE